MSLQNPDPTVRDRALGAVVKDTLLSWQTAVTVGITAALFVLVPEPLGLQPWFWLVAGGATQSAWMISAMLDIEARRDAIARAFERKYDLRNIRNRVSRERLQDALEYRRNMLAQAERARGAMRVSLRQTIDDVDDWVAHMYDLALHIDGFESNALVERDRRMVPQQIATVRRRLELEKDESVRGDLARQLGLLEQQQANLNATANGIKRAEIQLESTLSSLGTIYAQIALLGAKDVDSARTQRLRQDIQEEVASLQDTIEAMDEVQLQRLTLSS